MGLLIPICLNSLAQNVTQTVSFNPANLTMSQVAAPTGMTFIQLAYPGLYSSTEVGSPQIPVQYVNLIVPPNVDYSTIRVISSASVPIKVGAQVYPAQTPIPISEDSPPPPFVGPSDQVYNSNEPYPGNIVKFVRDGYFDGETHIITVAVYPVQYHPLTGQIDFYNSITFSAQPNPGIAPVMYAIGKKPILDQGVYDGALDSLVMNPADIATFYPGGVINAKTTGAWNVPFYEYVVITSHDLIPAFQELIGWKRRKGINAGVVDINDILTSPGAAAGDVVSNINDDAGKIRQYLSDAYSNGLVWAVLGGDSSIVPLRYAAGDINSYTDDPASPGDARIPADLYYSDFNGNWNVDGPDPDGVVRYGEDYDDHVDYMPEIFVGRMLCRTELEVKNQVHKIIRYERNPGRGDYNYLTRTFMVQADQMADMGQANAVAAQFPFLGAVIWNELPSGSDLYPTGPSAPNVIHEVENNYGLVSFFGHGSPNNIAVATSDYNGCMPLLKQKVTCLDAINGWCAPTIAGNGLDNLDDFNFRTTPYLNYPHLFYTIACETMPFDLWLKNGVDPDMGEVYTKYSKAGAFAYIGNTRYGWVYSSFDLFKAFGQKITAGNYHIGTAEGLSKVGFYDTWDSKTNNLIGCPETEMWTAYPSRFNAYVSGSGSSVTVSTGGVSAKICVMSAWDNGATYFQVVNGVTSYTFSGVPTQYAVCVTKHNYIPFLWQPNVYVQNHTFTGVSYIASDNLNAGQSVTGTISTGPVTVTNTANVIYDAEGDIIMDKGFEVQKGGWFEAK